MKTLFCAAALVLVAGLGMVACGGSAPAPAAAPAAPAKTAAAAKPAAATATDGGVAVAAAGQETAAAAGASDAGVATVVGPYVYSYNPIGKRDPFRNLFEEQRVANPDEGSASCNEPLCAWDIEQLNLVAVVSGEANPVAMLEDQQHTGHIIRRDTKVGKRKGRVTQILRDCVIITEYWTGPDGRSNPNPVKKCIQNDSQKSSVVDLSSADKRSQ